MKLEQLEYFIQVAETLNFTKAAEKCFISQTAMTQQIKALEQFVGVPLFFRDKHHVELTSAGRVYLGEARHILELHGNALKHARLMSEGVAGELTIGYISGFGQSDLAGYLASFHKVYPNIKLHLVRSTSSGLSHLLDTGACDLIYTLNFGAGELEQYRQSYTRSYPVMAVLAAEHPLAKQERLRYQDLRKEQFILMEPSSRPLDQMEEALIIYERGGYLPDVVGLEQEPETLLLMIKAGIGISILPEYIVRPYLHDKGLCILPLIKEDGREESIALEIKWLTANTNPALKHYVDTRLVKEE